MYALEVYRLTKHFGKTAALDEVSFSVRPGELLAVLGPAESGKTTLLRLISGLDAPDQGSISLNSKNIVGVPLAKRHIGLLFQNTYGLMPHLDVFENVAMPLKSSLVNKKEIKPRILSVAKTLEISHLLERKVSTLTDGERLRAALARALVKEPRLLLLDDILVHLDTPTRLAARRLLLEIQQTMYLPCILATCDQPDAFALADRVVLLNDGRIQQIGSRAELLLTPATLWAAQWLGFPPMNTLTGTLQGTYQADGLCYRVWTKGFAPLLPAKWTFILNGSHCQEVTLGIRSENIIPEWEFQEKWKPSLYVTKAQISAREWDQGKTLVQLRLPNTDEKFFAVFDISYDRLQLGQMISVAFDPEQFCLFHPQTQILLHAPPIPPALLKKLNGPEKRPFLEKYVRGHSLPGMDQGIQSERRNF